MSPAKCFAAGPFLVGRWVRSSIGLLIRRSIGNTPLLSRVRAVFASRPLSQHLTDLFHHCSYPPARNFDTQVNTTKTPITQINLSNQLHKPINHSMNELTDQSIRYIKKQPDQPTKSMHNQPSRCIYIYNDVRGSEPSSLQ